MNIGWTVGEEILFKNTKRPGVRIHRNDHCMAVTESCVLGLEKRNLAQIKKALVDRGQSDEFVKLEVVLRGNYLVKKNWRDKDQVMLK